MLPCDWITDDKTIPGSGRPAGAGYPVTTPHTRDPLVGGGGDQLQTGDQDGRAPSEFVVMTGRTDNPNEVVMLIDIQLMLEETFLVSGFWKMIKILMVGKHGGRGILSPHPFTGSSGQSGW